MNSEKRYLLWFFIGTFAWTWACYAPIAISGNSPYEMPWTILLILGGAGPSLVGVILVLTTYDQTRQREYWQRCFSVKRIPLLIWLILVLACPAITSFSSLINSVLGGGSPGMAQIVDLAANPLMWPLAAFISFMSGPWSEEFGWRGFALEPMISRFRAVPGTILLGAMWGIWHLPLFFMPATWHGQIGFAFSGFWMFMFYSVGLALIMTWIYQHTARSILSGMLVHFTANFTAQLIQPTSAQFEVIRAVMVLIIGAGLAIVGFRSAGEKDDEFTPHPRLREHIV